MSPKLSLPKSPTILTAVVAVFVSFMCPSDPVAAQVQTRVIEYTDGDVTLQGFVAMNPATMTTPAPGVLVVHQWTGLTDYEQRRCRELAELGYVAFALDIYGKGIRPAGMQEAAKQSTLYKSDRELFRRRLALGLQQLRLIENVDADRVAAIGYCFGGTGVLELARDGADVDGVVSFHGGLDAGSPEDASAITASVLILHGADDPYVPQNDVQACLDQLSAAGVDWQFTAFADAVHSFTQPMAGNDKSAGAAYNELADRRSWEAMKVFFAEIFGK